MIYDNSYSQPQLIAAGNIQQEPIIFLPETWNQITGESTS